jgi:hypothetical protein
LAFGDERPRQPVHIHAEVVQAPEKNVRGHLAALQDLQEQFARRLNDDPRHQGRERFVSGGGSPALLIGRLLGVGEGFNGLLPGARGNAVVGAGQIRLGDLQVEHGLALGLVLRFDDLPGFLFVGGAQAGAFAGGGVHAIEAAPPDASPC